MPDLTLPSANSMPTSAVSALHELVCCIVYPQHLNTLGQVPNVPGLDKFGTAHSVPELHQIRF